MRTYHLAYPYEEQDIEKKLKSERTSVDLNC